MKKVIIVFLWLILISFVVGTILRFLFLDVGGEGYHELNLSEKGMEVLENATGGVLADIGAKYDSVKLLEDSEIISDEELEESLPREWDYYKGDMYHKMRKVVVGCDKCDKRDECNYVCEKECVGKNMDFSGVVPLFGLDIEKEGECSCLCAFPIHINDFRYIQSIKNEDPSECEKIELDVGETVIGKEGCYRGSAILLGDESICEKISDEVSISDCYYWVAIFKKDSELCLNVIDDDSKLSRSSCLENVDAENLSWLSVPK
jgi:hypothetical protein